MIPACLQNSYLFSCPWREDGCNSMDTVDNSFLWIQTTTAPAQSHPGDNATPCRVWWYRSGGDCRCHHSESSAGDSAWPGNRTQISWATPWSREFKTCGKPSWSCSLVCPPRQNPISLFVLERHSWMWWPHLNPSSIIEKKFILNAPQQVKFEFQEWGKLTWIYFMKRWHLPQRERGLPVAAKGEKDTSISSSIPAKEKEINLTGNFSPGTTFQKA